MHKIIWSLSILVLSAALFSSCTWGKKPPAVTTQATSQSTLLTTPQIVGNPTAAPSITPMDVLPSEAVPSITALPDAVHLGTPWANFSLRFDPLQWEISAFDDGRPDLQALTHRNLTNCRITPNIPVGLGEDRTIEKKQKTLGQLELEARSFYQNGILKFVGYYNFLTPNGDGAVEVHSADDSYACIQAAEALFSGTEVILP
jgi:hypothetical protein